MMMSPGTQANFSSINNRPGPGYTSPGGGQYPGGQYKQSYPGSGFTTPVQSSGYNTGVMSAVSQAESVLNSVTYIRDRSDKLTLILETCPVKELSSVYQIIVDRVFMLGGGRGWGLAHVHRGQNMVEFDCISSFLSPTGALMTAANKLLSDHFIRYEFPVSRLSPSLISQISSLSPSLSTFISTRLTPSMQQLSLNSFEYYLFNFTAYMVQPYSVDNKFSQAGNDTNLYSHLVDEYFSYYLPCDGTAPPALGFQVTHGSPSHLQPSPDHHHQSTSTPARKSLLRNPTSSLMTTPTVSSPSSRVTSSPSSSDAVWRSEALLSIFSTVFLTQFSSSSSALGGSELSIPVMDTLSIIRMIIKHLHFFSNSGGPQDITSLDQLKRAALPSVKHLMFSMFK